MNRWIWLAGLLLACCVHQHMCDASCTPGPAVVQARLRRAPSAVGPSCLRVGRRRAAGSESCGTAQGTAEAEAEAEGQMPPPRSWFVGFSDAWVRNKTKTVDWNSNCTTKSNRSMYSGGAPWNWGPGAAAPLEQPPIPPGFVCPRNFLDFDTVPPFFVI